MVKVYTVDSKYLPFYLNENLIFELMETNDKSGDWEIFSHVANYRITKANYERLMAGQDMEKD